MSLHSDFTTINDHSLFWDNAWLVSMRPFGERSTLNPSIALQAKTPGRIEIEYKFLHTKIFEPTLLCFEQIELNA